MKLLHDPLFCVVVTLLVIVLFVMYLVVNRVPRTRDLDRLFDEAMLRDPTTRAFSLGRDPTVSPNDTEHRYRNVYRNDDGVAYAKNERFPVLRDGRYLTFGEHGVVRDREDGNGYTISGMETVEFTCPSGYETANCTMRAICDGANDAGRYKMLTYTQFNALHLYRNDFSATPLNVGPMEREEEEPLHPRIRVYCHENGSYELQTCPSYQLLDPSDKLCHTYDVCEDRLSGYKHNYPIADGQEPLPDTQYYLCEGNVSVLQTCADGTKFSRESRGCVNISRCYGMGEKRLALDDKRYVQCRNDVGTIIECPDGVTGDEANDTLACRSITCRPSTMTYDDGTLRYDYGAVLCNERDERRVIECDHSSQGVGYEIRGDWIERDALVYAFEHWPREIYDSARQMCRAVNKTSDYASLVQKGATAYVSWTALMSDSHPFDLSTRTFVCDENAGDLYRWDYANNRVIALRDGNVVPLAPGAYIDTASPCQREIRDNVTMPWQGVPPSEIYPGTDAGPLGVVAVIYNADAWPGRAPKFWPYYDRASKTYGGATVLFDTSNRQMVLRVYENGKLPPLGFAPWDEARDASDSRLRLIGADNDNFRRTVAPLYDKRVWYYLAGGEIGRLTFDRDTKFMDYPIACTKRLNTSDIQPQTSCYVLWSRLAETDDDGKRRRVDLLPNGALYVTANGMFANDGTVNEPPSFLPLHIVRHRVMINLIEWRIRLICTYGKKIRIDVEYKNDITIDFP